MCFQVTGKSKWMEAFTLQIIFSLPWADILSGLKFPGLKKASQVTVSLNWRPYQSTRRRVSCLPNEKIFNVFSSSRKTVVVGAGYIAVEMAGILQALGSEVHFLIRHDKVLRNFDEMLSNSVTEELEHSGITMVKNANVRGINLSKGLCITCFITYMILFQVKAVKGSKPNLTIETEEGHVIDGVDCLLWAIGRAPATKDLGLENSNIKVDKKGHVIVDDFQNTSSPNTYSVGDVAGKFLLTPGRKLMPLWL